MKKNVSENIHSLDGSRQSTDRLNSRAEYKAVNNNVSSQLAQSMAHASIDSMIALDKELNITAWNDATMLWSGYSYNDVSGKSLFEIFPKARYITGFEDALQRALQGMKSFLPADNGFYLPGHFEVHIVPLKNNNDEIIGILQLSHDVAHRLKVENELKALNAKLSRQFLSLQLANDELASFAKIAAHDLKEPLRKIYTFVELIMVHEADKLSNSGRSNFRRIQKSVQRMGLLTDDLVNFCEISRREERRQLDLPAMLTNEINRFKNEIDQSGAQIKVGALPILSGYPIAMSQILRQLLGNALKFQAGVEFPKVTVGCELVDDTQLNDAQVQPGQKYCRLFVADNGIGFEPQYTQLIFEMFQRLNPEGTYRGTGMGLAIARKAAHLHNGFITAESELGKGSIFNCYLPAL